MGGWCLLRLGRGTVCGRQHWRWGSEQQPAAVGFCKRVERGDGWPPTQGGICISMASGDRPQKPMAALASVNLRQSMGGGMCPRTCCLCLKLKFLIKNFHLLECPFSKEELCLYSNIIPALFKINKCCRSSVKTRRCSLTETERLTILL